MNDHEIMLAIQELLSGVEWSPDTLDQIAELLHDNGYCIEDLDPVCSTFRNNSA